MGSPSTKEVLLLKMPATRTADQGRKAAVGSQTIPFFALLEVYLASDSIVEIELTIDHVVPGWGGGIWSSVSTYSQDMHSSNH